MASRFALLGLALLGACCPAPMQSLPTAFRGTVVGVSPERSAMQLEPASGGAPIAFVAPPKTVYSGGGEALPFTEIHVGDEVYVRGTLQGGELTAELVQRLE